MKRILVALAIMLVSASAFAQPGNTPQQPPPDGQGMPPDGQGAPMPPDQVPVQPPEQPQGFNIDDVIARAQAASPTIENVVRGALRRARRSISIGPTVGFWGGTVPGQEVSATALTFGIGVETFKIPILPSVETLKQLVMERAKAKLLDVIAARFQGQNPDVATVEQFAKEVWEEAVQEVLGLNNIRARRMEKPSLSLGLEVNKVWGDVVDSVTPRVRFGFGLGRLTVAASLALPLGGDSDNYADRPVYLGLELVGHIMMSKNPRSSVLDVFLRADLEMRNRDTNSDMFVLGVRYLLDVL